MLTKNEKNILNFITFIPIFLVVCLSVISTYLFFWDNNKRYDEDIKKLKESYILKEKQKIKDEVYRIYDYINYEKNNSEIFLKNTIEERVNTTYKVINNIYKKYYNSENKEKILERIKDFLRSYRFNNNRGYFYVYDLNGINIMHPNKKLEGRNLIDFEDENGVKVIKKILNSVENRGEGYCEFLWTKLEEEQNSYKKITYNKIFKPLNILIGTGEYVRDYENELKQRILDYINYRKYSTNGYIFIFDYEGNTLAHIRKEYIGKNRINLKDKNGLEIIKEMIKIAKKEEKFFTYVSSIKPETNLPSKKTAFIKGFQNWNWVIGTGFYIDDLDVEINKLNRYVTFEKRKDMINWIIISLLITIAFLIISLYISKVLKNRFLSHKKALFGEINKNRQKDSMLAQQSKMAAMGEMIQNIAHQWRQPLSTISTVASGMKLKKEYAILEDKDFFEGIDNIHNSTKYLSQTIEDFRDFFSPNKEMKCFKLKDTLKKSIKLLDVQLSSNNIEIKDNILDIEISGYESELIQVFINIFNNSKDEFEKKNIQKKLIFIDAKKEEDNLVINIKDNAGGIKEKHINKIFKPYFTTKDKTKGTGVGLYMVNEIIKNMHGDISVKNDEYFYEEKKYAGALFEIKLPFSK